MSYQLPVRSPLPFGAWLAGLPGLMSSASGPAAHVEADLRAHFGARGALLLDGGTSALSLALRGALAAAGNRPVALPAYGCFDIATAAEGAAAGVVLYDTDPTTLGPEPESFGRALGANPSAVVLAHLYGVPVDVPRFAEMARSRGCLVIEDAAQGSGALLAGKPLGSFGDVSLLSFGRGKGVTGGGGGALLGFSERGQRIVEDARAHLAAGQAGWREMVMLAGQWALGRPGLYRLPASLPFLKLGETVYRAPHAARGASRSSVRVLMRTWPLADGEAGLRRSNAERLLQHAGAALRPVTPPPAALPGYLRLPMLCLTRVRVPVEVDDARPLGIVAGYPIPLSELPGFRDRWVNPREELPGARRLAAELVAIPTHGALAEADLLRLEHWMDRVNRAVT